jgi:hypothetical protein
MPLTRTAQKGIQRILCALGPLRKPARGNESFAVFLGLHSGAGALVEECTSARFTNRSRNGYNMGRCNDPNHFQ